MSTQKRKTADKTGPSQTIFSGEKSSAGKGPGHPQRPRLFSARVTWLDRWLARKLLQVAGDPPISLALWDGVPVKQPPANPVAKLRYWDRPALLKTIANDELNTFIEVNEPVGNPKRNGEQQDRTGQGEKRR